MNKRVILGGAAVLVIAVAVAGAQMFPRAGDDVPADLVTDPRDNPFAGLDQIFNEEGPDLGLTEEDLAAEDDFLRIRIPTDDADDGADNPLAGETFAGENVPYRSCERAPETLTAEYREGTTEQAALRAIYTYLGYERVANLKDCTCRGKVLPFAEALELRDALREEQGENWQPGAIITEYRKKSQNLKWHVEDFCGGRF